MQDKDRPTKMSMIIDGMDQSHCKCPHKGTQSTFSKPLTQHITAIKEHGVGVTIYLTLETVSKGANLTCYCILAQIEAWKRRNHGRYPEEIFIQVDGGSENANCTVLGLLELLAVKRIVSKVWFSRLPTGHTHEDIGEILNFLRTH